MTKKTILLKYLIGYWPKKKKKSNGFFSLSLFPLHLQKWHELHRYASSFFSSWFLRKQSSPLFLFTRVEINKLGMVSFAGFAFITGFLLGILTIVAAEVAAFLYLLKRLNRKRNLHESNKTSSDPPNSIDFSLNKQVQQPHEFPKVLSFLVKFWFLLFNVCLLWWRHCDQFLHFWDGVLFDFICLREWFGFWSLMRV